MTRLLETLSCRQIAFDSASLQGVGPSARHHHRGGIVGALFGAEPEFNSGTSPQPQDSKYDIRFHGTMDPIPRTSSRRAATGCADAQAGGPTLSVPHPRTATRPGRTCSTPLYEEGCPAQSGAHGLGSVASPNWRPLPTRERGRRRVLQNPAPTRHGHLPRTPMPRQQDTGPGAWRGIGLPIHWNPARASTGCPMSDDETGQFHW